MDDDVDIAMMRKNELEMHRMIDTNTDIDTNRLSQTVLPRDV